MKKLFILMVVAIAAWAAVRVKVNLRAGHPAYRHPNRTVVVRTRPVVAVRAPIVYAPPIAFRTVVVTQPPRDKVIWRESEKLDKDEDWVDTTFPVNKRGDALYLNMRGRGEVDFAEVTFDNGQVQVVDFKDGALHSGVHSLLDFKDGREVHSVRLVARAISPSATMTVALTR